jgi:hypothetical protein
MTNQTNRNPNAGSNFETMLSSEQAAVAFNLPFYFFRNPYKRKKLQIPHYYINKLVRYRLAELRIWHAQLGELLALQAKEAQDQIASQASRQAQGSEVAHA